MLGDMAEAMVAAYEKRKAAAHGAYARAKAGQDRYVLAALGLVGVLVRALWLAITRGHGYWTVAVVSVILAGIVVWLLRVRREVTRAWRLAALYEKGLKRLSGEERWSGNTGLGFALEEHLYERDLDVLGTHSLFDLLTTTRTVVGQSGLAKLLLDPADAATVRERQAAVREFGSHAGSPAELCTQVNQALCGPAGPQTRYITMFYAMLERGGFEVLEYSFGIRDYFTYSVVVGRAKGH